MTKSESDVGTLRHHVATNTASAQQKEDPRCVLNSSQIPARHGLKQTEKQSSGIQRKCLD